MKQAEEQRYLLPGLVLAGRYWPGEGVPILALHGFLDNANSFEPLAQHLPNPVLALDFAGSGKSQHRPVAARQSFLDLVEDVCELVPQLGWKEMILMGHSLGGGVASMVAASRVLPLTHLLLIDAIGPMTLPAGAAGNNFMTAMRKRQRGLRKKPVYRTRDAAIKARTKGFGGLSEKAAGVLCKRGLMDCSGGYTWCTDPRLRLPTLAYLEESQVQSILKRIRTPSLLIKAKHGLGGQGVIDHRLDYIRNLQVAELDGRHHVHMEHPLKVARVLLDFIRQDVEQADRA